jgi:2-polyprenyl-3-methyl-5-hydroxy-6-metoxy-1,4-benzoquinol methylase
MCDSSNGYESIAGHFMRARNNRIGPAAVLEWSASLAPGASILDLGCGHGVPTSETLIGQGFAVHAVDASPTLLAAFRQRFPHVPAECSAAEDSAFFHRTFDAAIAWGLLFLLPPETQPIVIGKVGRALNPGGHFLFTAPEEVTTWQDSLTGRESISLGRAAYLQILRDAGMTLTGERSDEGNNHYYLAERRG